MGIKKSIDRIEKIIIRIMGKGINYFDFGGLVVSFFWIDMFCVGLFMCLGLLKIVYFVVGY